MIRLKKIAGLLIGIYVLLILVLNYASKNINDYMFISTNIINSEMLSTYSPELTLYSKDGNIQKGLNYINGYMFPETKIGKYFLKIKTQEGEKYYPIEKTHKYSEKKIKLEQNKEIKNIMIFINIFTGIIFIYNLLIFNFYKDKLLQRKNLIFPFIILLLKVFFTNSNVFTDRFVMEMNLSTSIILNFYLVLYILRGVKFRNNKVKILLYTCTSVYIINAILFYIITCSNNIFIYILQNTNLFKSIFIDLYRWVDGPVLVLLILLIQSLTEKVKENLKKLKRKRELLILNLLIFSLIIQKYAFSHQVYFYLNLFEEIFLFWFIVLSEIDNYKKIVSIFLRVFLFLLFSYIFLLYTKNILITLILWGIFIVINIYAYMFEKVLNLDTKKFESLANRLYLIDDRIKFELQLKKEIDKNLEYEDMEIVLLIKKDEYKNYIKDKEYSEEKLIMKKEDILGDYSGGVRLKYNKNKFLGFIFIKSKREKLIYEEEKYLLELSETISAIASKIRMDYLQKELEKCIR